MPEENDRLTTEDFAVFWGIAPDAVPEDCQSMIREFDLRYQFVRDSRRDKILLQVLKQLDSGKFSVSGQKRLEDWEKGWQENLDEFQRRDYSLDALVPKCIRPRRWVRFKQQYAEVFDSQFEWQFFQIYRQELFRRFLAEADSIYEFGCGPGYNFIPLGALFPGKSFYGLDWAQSSVELVNLLAQTHRLNLKGRRFDFFAPDETFRFDENSAVLTICALEQVGHNFEPFLQYLLKQQPAICVHMEPNYEQYEENDLLDYVAMKYHRMRGYLQGFYPRLFELESQGNIQILACRRSYFGSLFHEGYSFIVWKPIR